jgi:CPA2 family monovalent cation:H+ antiporter-2
MLHNVEPVKDLFMAVFFISIGMLITPQLILENILLAAIIAVVFVVSKVTTIWLGCYITNMTSRDSFLVATSLIAMGEFAFIIAKTAFDAGAVGEDYYSAVIGAALITMVAMPVITRRQPQIFTSIARALPEKVRCSLSRIDEVHLAASDGTKASHPARADIGRRLSRIFVDVMVIVAIMIAFTVLLNLAPMTGATAGLDLLPQELVLLAILVIIAPIVHNMYSQVKHIARDLTALVVDSPRETRASERTVYLMFANLGTAAMILVVLAIVVPFLPRPLFATWWTIAVGGAAAVITYLVWDTVRQGYGRFCDLLTTNSEGEEER